MADIEIERDLQSAEGASIAEQRRALPDEPGVYIFRDSDGKVLYVGKARSIRKRVGGHFSGKTRTRAMTEQASSIEFLVTNTEADALLAEQQFIKRHRPTFNIRLRDDKSYPYIGISLDEEYPRVYFTRERHRSARLYFGPYSNAKRTRETLEILGKLFQYRTCDGPEPGRRSGVPCLDYYIKRCQAPCVGYIDREEYRRNIDAIASFLSGRYRDVERDLERKMEEASGEEEFERAAVYRDRLEAVRSLMERRSVAGEAMDNADVIAVATEDDTANAQVFQVRDGILAERQSFYMTNAGDREEGEVIEEFVAQYYSAAPSIPRLVVVGEAVREKAKVLADALAIRRGAAGRGAGLRARRHSPRSRAGRKERSLGAQAGQASRPSAGARSESTRSRRFRTHCGWTTCRSGSRASTFRTSAASTRWPRWWSSKEARRRSPTTGASGSVGIARAGPTISLR